MLPETSHDAETDTIELARAGDRRAFCHLVETYQTSLYNLCYRMLGNPHDAEEAAQETFLRAYTRLASYDPARPFKAWLYSIANHYCIDRLRRRRLIWLSLDDEPVLDSAAWRNPAPTPEETSIRHEREDEIQALLAEIHADDGSMRPYFGKYSSEKANALKDAEFDRIALGRRGLKYERLDQLTIELLLGLR